MWKMIKQKRGTRMQSILPEMHRVHLQRTENLCKFDFPPRTVPYLASWWDGNFRIGCWVLEINYFKSPGVRKSTDIKRSCDLISKTVLPSCTGTHSFFAPLTRYCSWTSFQVCWSPSPAVIFFWAFSACEYTQRFYKHWHIFCPRHATQQLCIVEEENECNKNMSQRLKATSSFTTVLFI